MTWTCVKAVLLAIMIGLAYFGWTALFHGGNERGVCEVPIVVEVLNGCGAVGVAREVGEILIDKDCDVMFVGNADDFGHRETLVVDRSGDRSKALTVASMLPGSSVIYQVSSAFFVDVTVVIGSELAAKLAAGD
jgi:hypothetical protein